MRLFRGAMNEIRMDREKFKELVVYVASKCDGDERFGDTKLNKVLYFADTLTYQHLGHPLTGARYQRLPQGPAPRALLPIREELSEEGAVRVEKQGDAPWRRTVTVATRDADTSLFTPEELELVDQVIAALGNLSAADVSELSHEHSPGWRLVEDFDDIPYETALISTEPPSPEVIHRGRDLAAKHGW